MIALLQISWRARCQSISFCNRLVFGILTKTRWCTFPPSALCGLNYCYYGQLKKYFTWSNPIITDHFTLLCHKSSYCAVGVVLFFAFCCFTSNHFTTGNHVEFGSFICFYAFAQRNVAGGTMVLPCSSVLVSMRPCVRPETSKGHSSRSRWNNIYLEPSLYMWMHTVLDVLCRVRLSSLVLLLLTFCLIV